MRAAYEAWQRNSNWMWNTDNADRYLHTLDIPALNRMYANLGFASSPLTSIEQLYRNYTADQRKYSEAKDFIDRAQNPAKAYGGEMAQVEKETRRIGNELNGNVNGNDKSQSQLAYEGANADLAAVTDIYNGLEFDPGVPRQNRPPDGRVTRYWSEDGKWAARAMQKISRIYRMGGILSPQDAANLKDAASEFAQYFNNMEEGPEKSQLAGCAWMIESLVKAADRKRIRSSAVSQEQNQIRQRQEQAEGNGRYRDPSGVTKTPSASNPYSRIDTSRHEAMLGMMKQNLDRRRKEIDNYLRTLGQRTTEAYNAAFPQ